MNSFNCFSDISNLIVGKSYNFSHKDIQFVQFIGVLHAIHIYSQTNKYDFSSVMRYDEELGNWVEWNDGNLTTFERVEFESICDDNPY